MTVRKSLLSGWVPFAALLVLDLLVTSTSGVARVIFGVLLLVGWPTSALAAAFLTQRRRGGPAGLYALFVPSALIVVGIIMTLLNVPINENWTPTAVSLLYAISLVVATRWVWTERSDSENLPTHVEVAEGEADSSAEPRQARRPVLAVVMGFLAVALVVGSIVLSVVTAHRQDTLRNVVVVSADTPQENSSREQTYTVRNLGTRSVRVHVRLINGADTESYEVVLKPAAGLHRRVVMQAPGATVTVTTGSGGHQTVRSVTLG